RIIRLSGCSRHECPLPFALCPLPFALCPLPFALCPSPARLAGRMFGVPGSKKIIERCTGDIGIARLKRLKQRLHDLRSTRNQSQASAVGNPTSNAGQRLRSGGCSAAAEISNGGRDRDRTCDPYHVKEVNASATSENQALCAAQPTV